MAEITLPAGTTGVSENTGYTYINTLKSDDPTNGQVLSILYTTLQSQLRPVWSIKTTTYVAPTKAMIYYPYGTGPDISGFDPQNRESWRD